MASSPTSSCSSSYHSPLSSSPFSSLPVMALKDKIVEKVMDNRVTLIVGETGCGKSSQVPQFLLEKGVEPILCTQPRRFAVVAVARMVAKIRNCEVGGEVGYHIGHSKVMSERSRIVFKTAGVLLDEMRDRGVTALKYKVIILDEVHERSVESDLVLTCVKQFVPRNNDLRVVLMSATADIARYKDYFKDLGRDERVEVLAIPNSTQQTIFQRKVLYLEQVVEVLGMNFDNLSDRYCSGPSPSSSDADIKPEAQKLIHDLVLHIHKNEPDIEKSILVFLPTYYSLEEQWFLLKPHSSFFKVHILHRSIDTEQALMAMKVWKSHRKVILATNIAESSVTIPGVAFVIDSCRSLQVFWDNNRKKESAELVWVSKSQAEQRKGRTGRTCDGQIYRLVTRSFFNKLNEHELPAILRLPLRQQVLQICCAESKAISDPKVLLQKALDPPDLDVIEDALSSLVHIRALEKLATHRGRYEPTFYGRLLASLSLSFDASMLIFKFGDIGLLREGILIGVLMDTQPLPILHPFGQEILDKHRLERLKQLVNFDEPKSKGILLSKLEDEWCSFHNLVQSSLHHVSEIYDDILNALHRFRPKFLVTSDGLPSYYDPYEFEHTCLLQSQQATNVDALVTDDEDLDPTTEFRNCLSVPYVGPEHFRANILAAKLVDIIKEIRVQYTEETSGYQHKCENDMGAHIPNEAAMCIFFINGSCNKGNNCSFSHSLQAKRPVCKFFFSFQGCRNGSSCFFSHDLGPTVSSFSGPSLPEDEDVNAASLLRLLPTAPDGCILLLDDTDLHFSSNLSVHYDASRMVSTTCLSSTSIFAASLSDVRILWALSHPDQTILSKASENSVPWREVQCVLWFAKFADGNDRLNLEKQRALVQNFFENLAIRILVDTLYGVRVILTMNNIRFSHLQVEKLGRECFFFLTESFPFDESSFGEFYDTFTTKKPMMVSRPICYVFDLHPPTDIQFGDYAATFHKHLHGSQ
ncbi:PREDICTED: DExH-box ATP-dependent RNA helicase DExH8 isoform X2 [Nelumbo nucifera]|uniref:DExH-box ATP-dependent RNA helicase DExH8 isoform X2 n=1 Tax=Nelumbo nucifera TaxID=4432 RepID=A0A1U8A084_NELNU|nr:PREDICTED: DExH-box ATP-dependent RNA helicase DExH8 isoform X2 [Nelumbo nucifera]